MRFASPIYFVLLVLVVTAAYVLFRRERQVYGSIRFSSLRNLKKVHPSFWQRLRWLPKVLRLLALTLLIVAMARPQYGWKETEIFSRGIDIMLLTDVSYSMKATDFRPNRLEAAKRVMEEFIEGRKGDRIGIMVFATTSFLLCPLTLDYGVVKEFLENIEFDIVDGNSTAIGMALAYGVKKLKDSTAKSKVIILLTDGENNAGKIEPLTAAEMAEALGIRVYTIGVGSEGTAMVPVNTPFGVRYIPQTVHIDEDTLRKIAKQTGGKYYRATSEKKLEEIYKEIDKLVKTKIEEKTHQFYDERMHYFVISALVLILLEAVMSATRFISLP
ncbi:VWA domain-containing protein [Candidatus Sumerlaeota bacterium]|nr:VWA domain-containing protein [Candidatus Sumerlaeota bacterium]